MISLTWTELYSLTNILNISVNSFKSYKKGSVGPIHQYVLVLTIA